MMSACLKRHRAGPELARCLDVASDPHQRTDHPAQDRGEASPDDGEASHRRRHACAISTIHSECCQLRVTA